MTETASKGLSELDAEVAPKSNAHDPANTQASGRHDEGRVPSLESSEADKDDATVPHLYFIHCVDDQSCGRAVGDPRGGSEKRMKHYPSHKDYQKTTSTDGNPEYINKVSAGPLVEDDDKYMIGSFFLVESTRAMAQKFVDGDPFCKNGVWKTVSIHRYVSVIGVKPHSGNL